MWPFKKTQRMSVDERAGLAATFLLDSLHGITAAVVGAAIGEGWEEQQDDAFMVTAFELLIFQLHLADRLTRVKAVGKNGGAELMDALLPIVRDHAPEFMRADFQEQYNIRQLFYGQCKAFTPAEGQPASGTLFWEFAKIVLTATEQAQEITKMLGITAMCGDMLRGIDNSFEQLGVYR
jgi:hypothetical protein